LGVNQTQGLNTDEILGTGRKWASRDLREKLEHAEMSGVGNFMRRLV
jgi:hypothetical protein